METLIGVGVFLLTLLIIYGGYFFVKKIYKPEQRKVHKRLKTLSTTARQNEAVDILKKRILSEIPWLNNKLLKLPFIVRLERLHGEANASHPLGVYVMLSMVLFFAGFLLAKIMRIDLVIMTLPSVLLASGPFFYLSHKRKKRMEKFERQLPDALELVARALKAGHAFTGGLRLVAEEFEDPVGTEFGQTLDEINFGMSVPEALSNLTQRVDSEDLRFFTVSVIIQRETGGNLAEILDNLGHLIRERFKFQGRVRVLSGEGRMSAIVLVAIPFFIAGFLTLVRPEYIKLLVSDIIGRVLVTTALILMACGIYVMKKMVSIKV